MLEIFPLNLVRLIAEMPLSANLFRLRSSIRKHAGSRGVAPVGRPIKKYEPLAHKKNKKIWKKKLTIFFLKKKFVFESSEIHTQKIFLNSEKMKITTTVF